MPKKPSLYKLPTVHTYWNSDQGFICPLCQNKLEYAYNDGGRTIITIRGPLWVVTNYYRCLNLDCDLHQSFPIVYEQALRNRKFNVEIWEKIIRWHFKNHLNYPTIEDLMNTEWNVKISQSSIRSICNFFEAAGKIYLDEEICKKLQENNQILLSLDGAQPIKGEPALWVFSDRLTGHVLKAVLLDTASADILEAHIHDIEAKYNVPIVAVISDKQRNIVNAIKQFNPEIPHAFCQFHFLKHITDPIKAKDSHISAQIKKRIRKLSIIQNAPLSDPELIEFKGNPLYEAFKPLRDELLNAIAVKSRDFDVFAGLEIFQNIEHIVNQLSPIMKILHVNKLKSTLVKIINNLKRIVEDYQPIVDQISKLKPDLDELRKYLGNRSYKSQTIRKYSKNWVYKLQSRLKRRNEEFRPENLKYKLLNYNSSIIEIWQEWVRLEYSYHQGLYYGYDVDNLEFTNNAKEQLFSRVKRHFRNILGQQNVSQMFQRHGGMYATLLQMDYGDRAIREVLFANELAIIEGYRCELDALYATVKRNWHIREKDSGNIHKLRKNFKNWSQS